MTSADHFIHLHVASCYSLRYGVASPAARAVPASPGGNQKIIYPNGFALSPYAEAGSPGAPVKNPPRTLWHASPGSSGGWQACPGRGVAGTGGGAPLVALVWCRAFQGNLRDSDLEYAA